MIGQSRMSRYIHWYAKKLDPAGQVHREGLKKVFLNGVLPINYYAYLFFQDIGFPYHENKSAPCAAFDCRQGPVCLWPALIHADSTYLKFSYIRR